MDNNFTLTIFTSDIFINSLDLGFLFAPMPLPNLANQITRYERHTLALPAERPTKSKKLNSATEIKWGTSHTPVAVSPIIAQKRLISLFE